jgi:hypothetical protein
MKQNLDGHKFKNDLAVENVVTRWQVAKDTNISIDVLEPFFPR